MAPTVNNALVVLWNTVVHARQVVAEQRNLPASTASRTARADLVAALEAYVHGLVDHGRPVPPALRDELRLQRLTSSGDRGYRGAFPLRRRPT